ncbi:hypothetical protein MT418_005676 [Batrachochytrium dendrobatidis]
MLAGSSHSLLVLLLFVSNALAFFEFFQNQHQQQKEEPFTNEPKSTACAGYLCPDNDICVDVPLECPCVRDLDLRCLIGDWYVCLPPASTTHTCSSFGGKLSK